MDKTRLKALLLEDSKSDALLLIREIKRGGFDVDYERVETAVDFKAALDIKEWDIIISDHSMPTFSAPEALDIVRRDKKLDVPFIIVSGTISEDMAVEAMKAGANDYFSKNKLTRLVPAISRELQEAEGRRQRLLAEEQLKKTEARFAKAFNASPTAIAITRLEDNRILSVNPCFEALLGYDQKEIIGKTGAELSLWANAEQRQLLIDRLHRSETIENVEVTLHYVNGEPIYALLSAEVIELDNEPCILSFIQDVTELKRQQKEILEAKNLLEKTFASLGEAVFVIDPHDRTIVICNDAVQSVFGYHPQELVGQNTKILHVNEEMYTQFGIISESALKSSERFHTEFQMRHKNGNIIFTEHTVSLLDEDKEFSARAVSVVRDITLQKESELRMQQYMERLELLREVDQAILNSVHPQVIASSTLQQLQQLIPFYSASVIRFDYENRQAILLAVETAGERAFQAGDAIPMVPSLILDTLREKRPYIIHDTETATGLLDIEQHVTIGGIRSYLAAPLVSGDTLLGTLNLLSDKPNVFSPETADIVLEVAAHLAVAIQNADLYQQIQQYANTLEQRVAERTAELHHQKERVETILRNSEDAILLLDQDGSILRANYSFCAIFGCDRSEIVGKQFADAARVTDIDLLNQAFQRIKERRTFQRVELMVHKPNGNPFVVDALLSPVKNDGGESRELVCSLRDITARKQTEAELRNALQKEKELNELKSSFTSMITHEFRTPLTILKISTETLIKFHDRLDDKKRQEKLQVIDQQIDRLAKLMDDVLLLGRGEQNSLAFKPSDVDLVSLVHTVVEEVQTAYQGEQVVDFNYDEPCRNAYVDEHLFLHILQNLLTNAFKYSLAESTVTIRLRCSDEATTLVIEDQGIGMPAEFQKNLFKMFHRAKNVEQDYEGTGLGLAIVKRAVDTHGGTINVDSVEGKGTSVTVTLPKMSSQSQELFR